MLPGKHDMKMSGNIYGNQLRSPPGINKRPRVLLLFMNLRVYQ